MTIISNILVLLVALLQFWFLVIEMFLWQTPKIRKAFGLSKEFAEQSASLAKNQGLYNGFLAGGLIWGLLTTDSSFSIQIKLFFLACVLIAGIYGAITANKRILYIQALPAFLALVTTVFSCNCTH